MLHTREFFTDCKRALKEGGILVTQNGLPFLFPEHLQRHDGVFASLFKRVAPYMCTQPCYFGGPFALNLATDDKHLLKLDAKDLAKRQRKRGIDGLKYWTPAVHVGAFALPAYAQQVVEAAIEEAEPRAKGQGLRRDRRRRSGEPSREADRSNPGSSPSAPGRTGTRPSACRAPSCSVCR